MSKRPIDAHRNGAFSMSIGTPEEGAFGEAFGTDDGWYMTKPNAIYKVQLADHIDPERKNPNVPNVQQKVYSVGHSSELVCRSLLTVRALITRERFGEGCQKAALAFALHILDGLLAMQTVIDEFVAAEDAASAILSEQRREDRSIAIPSIGDVGGRVKHFIQNAEHCFQDLFKIGCLLYDVERGWFDGLALVVKEKHRDLAEADFDSFQSLINFIKFIRNARHCIEHPKADQLIVTHDFRLSAEIQVISPTVQIVHSQTPEPEIPIRIFFESVSESVLSVIESFIANICAFNVSSTGNLPIQVMALPEAKRRNKQVRFGYAIGINGDWHPLQ